MLADFLRPVTYRLVCGRKQQFRSRSWWIVLAVDFAVGLALFLYVDCDKAYDVFWKNVDELVDKLDGVITWLTNNPAGLKLNEPVNTALASFFQYHIHLWKTFMLFSRYRIIWHVLCGSSCMGLSVCCALFADFFSLLTLHIVCFDVYESRWVTYGSCLPLSAICFPLLDSLPCLDFVCTSVFYRLPPSMCCLRMLAT
ncbi:hypothetical protein Y032_0471g2045 [Ancylostoma ceylanicum]|uniref:Uncharacterized protein n=1 Tax=Ancylostoma ceylanicum TaxID=53326 RepID=A0A016WY01_9BILA|nr:hypothetical protein Y032_0471g2045 [Ancylostoma ceylanicum]